MITNEQRELKGAISQIKDDILLLRKEVETLRDQAVADMKRLVEYVEKNVG